MVDDESMRRGASGCREQHGFAGERVRRNKIEKMFQGARVGIFVDWCTHDECVRSLYRLKD